MWSAIEYSPSLQLESLSPAILHLCCVREEQFNYLEYARQANRKDLSVFVTEDWRLHVDPSTLQIHVQLERKRNNAPPYNCHLPPFHSL